MKLARPTALATRAAARDAGNRSDAENRSDHENRPGAANGGFTLAELAVTIVIVGISLVLLLQGLGGAKAQAFYTQQIKVANQLARATLGEVAAGEYAEEAEFGLDGSYADDGYPEFFYEVYFGEENFPSDAAQGPNDGRHDSWAHQRDQEERRREQEEDEDTTNRAGEDDEDEELREPFQKVFIRVTFPVAGEYEGSHELQQWIPWNQVYGPDEEEEEAEAEADGNERSSGTGGR